jgi:hypothetical protein
MPSCSAMRSIYEFKPQYRRDYINYVQREGSHTIAVTASKKMAKQSAILTCSRLEAENPKNEECQISCKTNFRKKIIQTITLNKISIKYYHQKYTNIH